MRGKRICIEFDGAMSLSKVYLNGKYVGEWPYGYSSFAFDVTDNWNYEGKNILAVRLETNRSLHDGIREPEYTVMSDLWLKSR